MAKAREKEVRRDVMRIAKKMGFEECCAVSGQSYSRKVGTKAEIHV